MQPELIRERCGDESEEGQDVQVPGHLERLCHTLSLEKLPEARAAAEHEDVYLRSSLIGEAKPLPITRARGVLGTPGGARGGCGGAGPLPTQLAELAACSDGYHERRDSASHRLQLRDSTSSSVLSMAASRWTDTQELCFLLYKSVCVAAE